MSDKESKLELLLMQDLSTDGDDINSFISDLKEAGASPIETMKILINKLNVNLGQAKGLTFNSSSWQHLIGDFNDFNQMFLNTAAEEANIVEKIDGEAVSVTYNLKNEEEE